LFSYLPQTFVNYFPFIALVLALLSCNKQQPLVDAVYIDSLLSNHQPSQTAVINQRDLEFWEGRVDALPENFVNLFKYASALAGRFHIYGDIYDLQRADSIMQSLVAKFKEPGMLLSMAGYKMLRHQFQEAKKNIDAVVQLKAEKFAAQMMLFDASFELGDEYHASAILQQTRSPHDYSYNFRLSKFNHYKGNVDSSIKHMMKAASLAHSNAYLRTAALSNAADLYVHVGKISKAIGLYKQCLEFNSCDFHSLMGLGWLALVHDGNELLAKKIFAFTCSKLQSPDPLLTLSQASELSDTAAAKLWAMMFVHKAGLPVYGDMYNKYLIQVYTSVLNDPEKALQIAQNEIKNRSTPQTNAWLAWCLFLKGEKQDAYNVYQQRVSGRPLEALELYWMGKMMKGLGKAYTANEFFKAAKKNKYDLSPAMCNDLERNLQTQ
jgi:tetratricopeptide (TPR) repeat protein